MPDSPVRQGGDHVGPAVRGVSTVGAGSRPDPARRTGAATTAAQLVHHVLPIALAARTFRVSQWCRRCGGSGRRAMTRPRTSSLSRTRSVHRRTGAPRSAMYRSNFRFTKPPAEYAELHPLVPAASRGAHAVSARRRRRLRGTGLHRRGSNGYFRRAVMPASSRARALPATRAAGCGGAPHRRLHRASLTGGHDGAPACCGRRADLLDVGQDSQRPVPAVRVRRRANRISSRRSTSSAAGPATARSFGCGSATATS